MKENEYTNALENLRADLQEQIETYLKAKEILETLICIREELEEKKLYDRTNAEIRSTISTPREMPTATTGLIHYKKGKRFIRKWTKREDKILKETPNNKKERLKLAKTLGRSPAAVQWRYYAKKRGMYK